MTKFAIIGGTGALGAALAGRLSARGHEVWIGSRDPAKAQAFAADLTGRHGGRIAGAGLAEAAAEAEICMLTVPYAAHVETLARIRQAVQGKVVVDATVPLRGGPCVLLWPEDPDASARRLRAELQARFGVRLAIVSDSLGRAWRMGATGAAIGVAGMKPLRDRRGENDLFGRELKATVIGVADEIAAAASLVIGEAAEGTPRRRRRRDRRAAAAAGQGPVPMSGHVIALCGGVGGGRLARETLAFAAELARPLPARRAAP